MGKIKELYKNVKNYINGDNFSLVEYRYGKMQKELVSDEYILPEKRLWYNNNKRGLSEMLVFVPDNGPVTTMFRAKCLEGDGEFNYSRRR